MLLFVLVSCCVFTSNYTTLSLQECYSLVHWTLDFEHVEHQTRFAGLVLFNLRLFSLPNNWIVSTLGCSSSLTSCSQHSDLVLLSILTSCSSTFWPRAIQHSDLVLLSILTSFFSASLISSSTEGILRSPCTTLFFTCHRTLKFLLKNLGWLVIQCLGATTVQLDRFEHLIVYQQLVVYRLVRTMWDPGYFLRKLAQLYLLSLNTHSLFDSNTPFERYCFGNGLLHLYINSYVSLNPRHNSGGTRYSSVLFFLSCYMDKCTVFPAESEPMIPN